MDLHAEFGILYPLWNHAADEGRLLERAAGEVGLDHLTVPVLTGPLQQFCLGRGGETPHFHTEGGWHFRPSTKAYATTALRPAKARWFAGGDVLAQVRARAAALNVRLLLRIDLRAVAALVEQERHLCQRNAWGQEVPSAGPCACNPDLRELLRVTLEDLRRYEPTGYELCDWSPDSAVDRSSARPLDWDTGARRLLDLCFCASCRQIAAREGVDADQAARSVRVEVERRSREPVAGEDSRPADGADGDARLPNAAGVGGHLAASSPVDRDPLIAAYIAARVSDCRLWLQQLTAPDPDRRYLLVYALDEPPPYGNRPPWPRLVRRPRDAAQTHGSDWLAALLQAALHVGGVALPVWRPTFSQAADLVRVVADAARAGVRIFDFEGLDEAAPGPAKDAPEALTWLKQAVRFARRG